MSEQDFRIFQNVIQVIGVFLYAGCFSYFHFFFILREKKGTNKILKLFVVFMLYLFVFLTEMLLPISVTGIVKRLFLLLIMAGFSGFLEIDIKFEILLTILYFTCQSLSLLMLESIQYIMNELLVQNQTDVAAIFYRAAVVITVTMILQILLCLFLLSVIAGCFACKNLRGIFRFFAGKERNGDISINQFSVGELFYLALIPLSGIVFVMVILRLSLVIKGKQVFQMYESYPVLRWVIPLLSLMIYIGTIVSVRLWQNMRRLQEEKGRLFIKNQQIFLMEERMHETERFYDGVRQMKHEMKNHLTNIKGLSVSGNYEELDRYISQMDESMDRLALSVHTGNTVTDVIISDKKRTAERKEIRFEAEFVYPSNENEGEKNRLGYDAYDIGIILNNLLENAIEACEKQETGEKYVFLYGKQKRRFFVIEVRNSFEGEFLPERGTGLPASTKKEESGMHGIGLKNVKKEAEKYFGNLEIHADGKECRAVVMLQERRE